jgi:hypothetical protein
MGSSFGARPFAFVRLFPIGLRFRLMLLPKCADDKRRCLMEQRAEVQEESAVDEFDGQLERRGVMQDEPLDGVERRQHPRFAVDGWAEVLVADGSLLFRGRVLDLSVAGCYIETEARLRLEPGTQVEMVFRVNEIVFRPMATSRAVRPGEGAGFLFLNLNARMQSDLELLIAALKMSC